MSKNSNPKNTGSRAEIEFSSRFDSFTPMPGLGLGATDSAHGVFFGRLKNDRVAVKHYSGDNAVEKAKHEASMLELVAKLGFLTLSPLRVVGFKNDVDAYLITEYQEDLTTMSAIVQRRNEFTSSQVKRTAETLGALHAQGVTHGDSQIKNFALKRNAKGIMVFDFENGGHKDFGGHKKNSPYQHDLNSLVQSLAYKTYGGLNQNAAAERIYEDVIEPYMITAPDGLGAEAVDVVALNSLGKFIDKHEELHGLSKTA